MSHLVAIAYPDQATAQDVARTLAQLQKERSIQLDDLAVAVAQDDGKIKLKQSFSPAGAGATGGALWGGLIGLLFLAPLLGMAVGAAAGAAGGALADYGVDDKFMKDLAARTKSGGAILFVLVRQSTPDKVLPRISEFGGDVVHTSLGGEAEQVLKDALEGREHAAV